MWTGTAAASEYLLALRLLRKKPIAAAMTARPPTTPPAMAPTGVFFLVPVTTAPGGAVDVATGLELKVDVRVLVVLDSLSIETMLLDTNLDVEEDTNRAEDVVSIVSNMGTNVPPNNCPAYVV